MSIIVRHHRDSGTWRNVLATVEAAGYRLIVLDRLAPLPPGPVYEGDDALMIDAEGGRVG